MFDGCFKIISSLYKAIGGPGSRSLVDKIDVKIAAIAGFNRGYRRKNAFQTPFKSKINSNLLHHNKFRRFHNLIKFCCEILHGYFSNFVIFSQLELARNTRRIKNPAPQILFRKQSCEIELHQEATLILSIYRVRGELFE